MTVPSRMVEVLCDVLLANGERTSEAVRVSPALETLMLVFGDEGLPMPQRALFLGAEPHPDFKSWPELMGWQPFKPIATSWDAAEFLRTDQPTGKWPLILMLPGKSKDETLVWFAMAADLLEAGGMLVVAMPNTAGAGRFEKELSRATGSVTSISKNKCRAFHASHPEKWDAEILTEWRSLGGRKEIEGTHFLTEAGIFSSDHIDPGSKLLADHVPASLRGKVADLGAGWGFLTDAVLRRCPKVESIDLYEADSRALDCAKLNLQEHEGRTRFHWHDVTKGLPEVYDVIVMNPPFHTGQATDVDLGKAFLRTAFASLRRGGKLLLVANRQLPYEAELAALGMPARKLAEDSVYKILSADRR